MPCQISYKAAKRQPFGDKMNFGKGGDKGGVGSNFGNLSFGPASGNKGGGDGGKGGGGGASGFNIGMGAAGGTGMVGGLGGLTLAQIRGEAPM